MAADDAPSVRRCIRRFCVAQPNVRTQQYLRGLETLTAERRESPGRSAYPRRRRCDENPRIAAKFRRVSKVGTALATGPLHQLDPALPVKETFVKTLHLMLLMLVALAAAGCNTTRGFGQDVEATGEAIEETAEDAKDDDDR